MSLSVGNQVSGPLGRPLSISVLLAAYNALRARARSRLPRPSFLCPSILHPLSVYKLLPPLPLSLSLTRAPSFSLILPGEHFSFSVSRRPVHQSGFFLSPVGYYGDRYTVTAIEREREGK